MEKIKYMFMAVLVALVSMTVTSCSDDDDDENVSNQKNPASMIVGTYTGTLREVGDNTDGAPCYVAFERLSNTTVMLTRFLIKNMVLIRKRSILRFLSQMVFISLIQNRVY